MSAAIEMNAVYEPLLNSKNRYELIYGGAGSGKSHFAAQKIVLKSVQGKGRKWLVARKVGRTNRHSTFALIREVIDHCGLTDFFKVNKTDMEMTLPGNNTQIIFVGLDDVSKLKSIAGITNIWLEEAYEASPDDFKQLDLRLRGISKHPKQMILTFNPVSALSWIKKRFFDTPDDQTTILKTTYKDNRFIDDEYRAVIENLKDQDPVFYSVYGLGDWGVLGNQIFTNYEVRDFDPRLEGDVCYGLDFGFNNPSALVRVCNRDEEIYLYEELYASKLTNTELIGELDKIQGLRDHIIYADAAEPARIQEISQAGYNIVAASKDVKKGIDKVKSHKLHVHPDSANMIKEIQGYTWRKDKDGNPTDEPVKFADHAMDAMRYAIYSHSRAVVGSTSIDIL